MTDFYSRNDVNYNGDVYSIPFPYIKEKEIQVFLDDTLFEDWFFLNDSQIKLRNIPQEVTSNTIVSVRRITDIDKKVVTYTNNTLLNKENLNLSQDQLLFAVQEIYDNNVQFEIDTENNILQNRTEIDAQIEANKEELQQIIADNKQEILDIQAGFEQEVNTTIDVVKEAAGKVNELEQAVEEAKTAAQTATTKSDETREVLANAITEMDSKLATAESTMDSRLSSATATMNEKLSAANTAVENATQQANLATQKAQEILDINPAKTDLSNLSDIGEKHFLNKSQITNCLLEVPQRIKLELADGVLTLKAGSEVIMPNGFEDDGTTRKFDYMKVESDTTVITAGGTGQYMILYNNGRLRNQSTITCYSGSTQPTVSATYATWYDTTSNKVKLTNDKGATWTDSDWSLPFCLTTTNAGVLESVDQVFNGMGYIGSTLWLDKGVKALIPDGLNIDGTYKNKEVTTNNAQILVNPHGAGASNSQAIVLTKDGVFSIVHRWVESETEPTANYTTWYNPKTNIVRYSTDGTTWGRVYSGRIGKQKYTFSSGVNTFTDITANTALKLIDYNTMASGTAFRTVVDTYVNGTSWYRVWSDGWIEQGGSSSIGKGATTITFLKSFSNASYTFTCTPISSDGAYTTVTIKSLTAQNIVVYLAQSNYIKSSSWYACGY